MHKLRAEPEQGRAIRAIWHETAGIHEGARGRRRWQTALKCKISYTLGGQAALNDNGVRLHFRNGRKGSVEFLIRSAYRDWLNLNTCNTAGTLSFIEN